jgi:CheY-like chemotaxis protein/HAMP domain-containing protein
MKMVKLKYKLIAIILTASFAALFSYAAFVTVRNVRQLREDLQSNVVTIARVTGNNLVAELSFLDKEAAKETLDKLSSITYIKNAVIFDAEGWVLADYNAVDAEPLGQVNKQYGSGFKNGYFFLYEQIIFNGKSYGNIYLKASTQQLNQKIMDAILELLGAIAFLGVVLFLLSWRLQRYISDPILHLANSFRKVSTERDYSLKLDKVSDDEIGVLYDGFNEMMEQIHRRQEELKQHKDHLETMVEQRTRELRAKNIQLTRAKESAENANRLKSEFLANMSHEIRTPMNAILGFTDILIEDETDTEKHYYLDTIKKSGGNLLNLINDILDFSKIEADRFEVAEVVFSPRKLIYHLEMMFSVKAQEKNLYFTINGLKDLPAYVLGDSQKLNQVLINILGNAFKFTHSGGVTMDCQYDTQTRALEIKIKDTGIGISIDQQKIIFDPFRQADGSTTREYGGTGLGLAIASRMMKLLGGSIRLESRLGEGALFIVSLPLPEAESIEETAGITYREEDDSTRDRIIGVIEDNPQDREILKTILQKHRYHVIEIANTPEIVEKVVEQKVDLVILDIVMAGLSGFEINDLLKKDIRTAHIPVIVYSGSDQVMKSLTSGIVDYIKKPVRQEEVLKRIYINLKLFHEIKNIFVVDDDEKLLNIYCSFLQRHKYNCFAFSSGKEAIKKIQSGIQPDLIILDLLMPEMDGFQFLKALRGGCRQADIPVIIVTVKELTVQELEKLKNVTLAVYSKGIDVEGKFISFLDSYFKRKRAAGETLVRRWIDNIEEDEQIKRILLEAIETLPDKISELEQAIVRRDINNIQLLSHSLKGMALSLEMTEVGELCKEINDECQGENHDLEKISGIFIELKELVSSISVDYFPEKPAIKERKTGDDNLDILVAEDDSINQRLIKIYFKRMGRKCDIAENGKVALEMLKKKKYDVLFLDIQMPVMDGLETIRRIRGDAQLQDIYVIALTAHALKGDQEKCISAGCNDYISKPVKMEALVERLESFIAGENKPHVNLAPGVG